MGKDAARLVQLDLARDGGRVAAAAEVDAPDGAGGELTVRWAAAVREAVRTRGFSGRRAVACLRPDDLLLRHVKVRASAGQALDDALLGELEDAFKGDAPLVQHVPIGEVLERGERLHEFILLAAPMKAIQALLAFLEHAGLDPQAIDAEPFAVVRSLMRRRRRRDDGDLHAAAVHVGDEVTLMTITSAMQPLFMKQLPIGATHLHRVLQERLDLRREDLAGTEAGEPDPELRRQVTAALRLPIDSLATELALCLRYHTASRRSPAGVQLLLVGPGAAIPGFPEALSESLGGAISRPDPFTPAFSGVDAAGRLPGRPETWCVPLGLSLRGVEA